MRTKLAALIVLATVGAAHAQVIEGSRAFTFQENNNSLIAIPVPNWGDCLLCLPAHLYSVGPPR